MFACALAMAATGPVSAIGPEAPDEGAIELDLAIQALKDEVIQLNRDAQLAEDSQLYPIATRLSVYVSTSLPHLLLQEISVSVDGGTPAVYRYQDRDARALLAADALQRVVRMNVGRGTHNIKVSFSGNFAEKKKEPEPVSGVFEGVFEKGIEPAEIELRIGSGRGRNSAVVKMHQWKAVE